jgi:hypothetical protein
MKKLFNNRRIKLSTQMRLNRRERGKQTVNSRISCTNKTTMREMSQVKPSKNRKRRRKTEPEADD